MACLPMYLNRPDADLLLSWLNEDAEVAFLVLAGRKTRPTPKLKRLLASGQGFTFYNIGGVSPLVKVRNRWRAVQRLDALPDGGYTLWHVPSGPLPLLAENQQRRRRRGTGRSLPLSQALGFEDEVIEDPWSGWIERSPGADVDQPYFGPGHPGVIHLEVQTRELQHLEMENDLVTVRRRVVDEGVIGLSYFGWIGNHYRTIGSPARPATERWWRRLRHRVQGMAQRVTQSGPLHGPGAEVYAFPAALRAIQGGMARGAQ